MVVTAVVCTAGLLIASRSVVDGVPRVSGLDDVLSDPSDNIVNYLLVGSDSRANGDPNTGQGGDTSGNRSDTIMVLRFDKSSESASLLSIPRDLWVQVPTRTGKINGAYNDGPAALIQTVKDALQLPIHHYVEIDFYGFKSLIDALDGVDVCFEHPTRDLNTGLNIVEPGCFLLNGTEALAYARSRHFEEFKDGDWYEDPTSDLGRSRRQRDFVNRSLQKAIQKVKGDPFVTGDLVRSISAAIRIDEDLDPIDAAASLRTAVGAGLKSYSLPVGPTKIDGQDVLLLDDDAAVVLAYFRGEGPAPEV